MNFNSAKIYLVVFLTVLCACDKESRPIPTPPDIQVSLNRLASPSGQLTPQTALALGDDALDLLDDINYIVSLSAVLNEVFSELNTSIDGEKSDSDSPNSDQFGLRQQALTAEAGLYVQANYICGPSDDINADRHGSINLFGQMETGGFAPLFWGDFLQCLFVTDDETTQFDGSVVTTIPSDDGSDTFLDYRGTITKNDTPRDFDLLVNIIGNEISLLRTVLEQDFVVHVVSEIPLQLSVVDCVGRWACDMDARTCGLQSSDGSCDPAVQEVRW